MLATLGVLLLIAMLRRAMGGVVMSENRIFYPTMGIVGGMIAYEMLVLWRTRMANRASELLADWRWHANAAIELAAPIALLTIYHFNSPRGEVAALSGPTLLVIPLLVLLSILRLRPALTLWTGLFAAAAHAVLVVRSIVLAQPEIQMYPVLFAYSVFLAFVGMSGALVAKRVKHYVHEAADEAASAAAALERVALMERDLSIARDIQRGLLPTSPPDLPGYAVAGMSNPADQTGGDYYDWQTLPDGRVTLIMADATGHGIGPALVMAVCRAYARASTNVVPMIAPFLTRLNSLVHADVGGSPRFITFAMAIVDPTTSRIELLSAGHGPTFFYRATTRSIKRFVGDGFPLGIVPDGEYSDAHTLDVEPGDILLLLTDGFYEWQRPSDREPFGIERIEELILRNASTTPERLLQIIDSSVRAFTAGSPQTDDMTAVVVKKL